MTEYELDKICEQQPDCGCDCMRCPIFAKYMNSKNDWTMDEKEFMERMKRANSKVKDGMAAQVIDMLPEDRELASHFISRQ